MKSFIRAKNNVSPCFPKKTSKIEELAFFLCFSLPLLNSPPPHPFPPQKNPQKKSVSSSDYLFPSFFFYFPQKRKGKGKLVDLFLSRNIINLSHRKEFQSKCKKKPFGGGYGSFKAPVLLGKGKVGQFSFFKRRGGGVCDTQHPR